MQSDRRKQSEGDPSRNRSNNFKIVGMAASSGGVKAISRLVSELPSDFYTPILIIQHMSPNLDSHMAEILSRVTSLKVKPMENGERIKRGTIYTAVPNMHVIVNPEGTISLAILDKVNFTRPAADVTFISMAASCKDKALGVILTGAGMDGALGALAINKGGGKIIAQEDPEVPSMPESAIRVDDVDFIVPLDEIAPLLVNLCK